MLWFKKSYYTYICFDDINLYVFFLSENRHTLRYIHRKTCFETYLDALPLFLTKGTGVLVTVTVAAALDPPFTDMVWLWSRQG